MKLYSNIKEVLSIYIEVCYFNKFNNTIPITNCNSSVLLPDIIQIDYQHPKSIIKKFLSENTFWFFALFIIDFN